MIKKLINAGLAGLLVTLGGCASGAMSWEVAYFAGIAGLIVAVSQFKDGLMKTPKGKKAETALFQFV